MAAILVTAAQAAQHYGIGVRTIRRWAAQERLIRYGTPRRLTVDLREVDQLYHTHHPRHLHPS
ncbi:helix-turn-helix domain-containing protein [Streptomyces sp. TRM66268-LWL]|uniref:Helix-turn-helix domain-containing protein n=1 Tax=Streptomyces polyasparticus TaxID=2767826 RepID=A0ABR7SX92_9ACTN|nr:helix-turn-helix domain-containing protein [Streptomyces polyasparticus]MBC9719504.1 helix-turn-helix domain-containing protein [Streptomyces polyasparticus]